MKRILLLVLAAIGAAFLMVGKGEADHYEFDPLATPQCQLNPCVLEVGNAFGEYGTANGDSRYQQAMEMMVNDLSKSGVYLKLVPSSVFDSAYPTSGPAGDILLCFPVGGDPYTDPHAPCTEAECIQSPWVEGYNCVNNQCTTWTPTYSGPGDPPQDPDLGGDLAVCASMQVVSTAGYNSGTGFTARIECHQGLNCNPMNHVTKRLLCHETGHTLGLNHYDTGCMLYGNPRINKHDADSVLLWHPARGTSCTWQFPPDYCLSNLTVSDADEDNDGVENFAEGRCGDGGTWYNPNSWPERIGNGVDDNWNGLVDETLWTSYYDFAFTDLWTPDNLGTVDCDGDGFTGNAERAIFVMGTNPSKDQDRCGGTTWPLDLMPSNNINLQDTASFVAPVHRLNTSTGNPDYSPRWDLIPTGTIDLQDMAAITAGVTAYPPMFLGVKAWNGPSCTD